MTDDTNALSGEQDAVAKTEQVEATPADDAAQAKTEAPEAEQGDKPGDEAEDAKAKAEDSDKADESEEEDKPKRNRVSAKERISQITQQKHDALREAAFWKAKFERASKQERPDPNKYDDPDEYSSDLAAYKFNQSQAAEYQESAKDAETRAQQVLNAEYEARVADFAAETPDYHNKVTYNVYLPIDEVMADEIKASDYGPQVAYYLANNPQEAKQIASLTDARQKIRAIGRLEARVSTPPPKRVTQAPEPIKPVAGKRTNPVLDLDKMDMEQFARKWKEGSILK